MGLNQSLLVEFDQEMATTRKTLERITDDKLSWKPHEKSMSLGGLATHIANMTNWGTLTLTEESFDIAPNGEQYREAPVASVAEALAKFDGGTTALRAALEAASDEQLLTSWSLLNNGQPIFTMPRIAVLRGMIFNHLIHHRGQLSVYLRLNDIPVPSIYGPSADEGN